MWLVTCRILLAVPLTWASAVPTTFEEKAVETLQSSLESQNAQLGSRISAPALEQAGYNVFIKEAQPFRDYKADELHESDHSLELESTSGSSSIGRILKTVRDAESGPNGDVAPTFQSGEAPIQNVDNAVYLTKTRFGNQNFTVVIDTGSADTWLARTGYRCTTKPRSIIPQEALPKFPGLSGIFGGKSSKNSRGSQTPKPSTKAQEEKNNICKFGKIYDPTISKTFEPVPGIKFKTKYSDNEVITGTMGKETVTLGGITVKDQAFGLATQAGWKGDTFSSGLVGLAFPSITRAFSSDGQLKRYNPIFSSMHQQKLIKPIFALTLNRANEEPGMITLGGLPKGKVKYSENFARAKMQVMSKNSKASSKPVYTFYAVKSPQILIGDKKVTVNGNVVIDSGTTLAYLPFNVIETMTSEFKPPVRAIPKASQIQVPCTATPPEVFIAINGTKIAISPEEVVHRAMDEFGRKICILGFAPTTMRAPLILGGSFLRGVVAAFDVGAAEMRFHPRIR